MDMYRVVKYLASYDINDKEKRTYVLAATNKIDYICSALNSIGICVDIISVATTRDNKFYKSKITNIQNNTRLNLFSTIPGSNALFRKLSLLYTQINLFFYLISNVKKNEIILVYHGLAYGNSIHMAKMIKKFKIMLEVEEIYQNVKSLGNIKNMREYRDFEDADMYIFPTKLLNDKVNKKNKPYAIIHGTYQVEKDRHVSFNDNKIHVVYAGTFDPIKGGAIAAINAAKWLSDNYHIHILGFGSEKEVQQINKQISEVNKNSDSTVTYDGLLSGEEYIQFLQKCHIGLSTQNPDGDFNDTSFPSKILSYMANGLRVVTIRIPAIESSYIGKDVYYYDRQDPKDIANAIMSINFKNDYDSRKKIDLLDHKFKSDLRSMI